MANGAGQGDGQRTIYVIEDDQVDDVEGQLELVRDVKRQLLAQMMSVAGELRARKDDLAESMEAFVHMSSEVESSVQNLLRRSEGAGVDLSREIAMLDEVHATNVLVKQAYDDMAAQTSSTASGASQADAVAAVLQEVVDKSHAKTALVKEELECLICKIVTKGSIFQCKEGHMTCGDCAKSHPRCAMKCGYKCDVRCRAVERLIGILDVSD